MRRALTLALLATAALPGCGGGDDTATLSKADVAVLERFESDLLAYRATADRITARFEDPSLDARGVRRASRADIAELTFTSQSAREDFAATQARLLDDAHDELPEDQHTRLRAAFAAAG